MFVCLLLFFFVFILFTNKNFNFRGTSSCFGNGRVDCGTVYYCHRGVLLSWQFWIVSGSAPKWSGLTSSGPIYRLENVGRQSQKSCSWTPLVCNFIYSLFPTRNSMLYTNPSKSNNWYTLYFFFRTKYLDMHGKFPARPMVMLCRVVRSFIVVKGQKLYITPEIEDFLASGANYSHSGAAVHQTNIKLLL